MDYQRFIVGAIETNCYLVWSGKEAGVIDPGGPVGAVIDFLENHHLTLRWIINTHGHADHIAGNGELQKKYGAPVWIHEADRGMLTSPRANLSFFLGEQVISPDAALILNEGETVSCGAVRLKVLATPGHTPGGISLYGEDLVFTGDALFYESVGRTDLPGGDHQCLLENIRTKLLTLPSETTVLPGHGDATRIGHEQQANPYLTGRL